MIFIFLAHNISPEYFRFAVVKDLKLTTNLSRNRYIIVVIMAQATSYSSLIGKLDKFIRKYYTNQLIRGAIFSAVYVLGFFLAINLLEY